MQADIHQNVAGWLDASLKGRLSEAQREALRCHLAECPQCLQAACEPDFVEQAADILSRREGPAPGFEDRVIAGVRREIARQDGHLPLYCRPAFRIGIRAGLAALLLALLVARNWDLHYFREDSWSGRLLSAATLVFLRAPRGGDLSSLPAGIAANEQRFAVAHELTKSCVGMLLWVSLALLCTFLLLDLAKGRFRLQPRA